MSRRAFVGLSIAAVGGLVGGRALLASVDLPEAALASLPAGTVKAACKHGEVYIAVGSLPDGTPVVWEYRNGSGWSELARLDVGVELADITSAGGSLVAVGTLTTTEQVGTVMGSEQDPPSDREPAPDDQVDEVELPVFRHDMAPGIWVASAAGDDWQRAGEELSVAGCLTAVAASGDTVLAVGGLTHDDSQEGAFPLVARRQGAEGGWEQVAARGLPHYSEGVLGALAATGGRWLLASTDVEGSALYESTDAGTSWALTEHNPASGDDVSVVTAIAAGRDVSFGLESVTGAAASVASSAGVTPVGGSGGASVQAIFDPADGRNPMVIATGQDGTQQASMVRS